MAKLYCKCCNRGCEEYCFDSHRSRYYCHDSRCPGSAPHSDRRGGGSSRSSSSRPELSRSSSKRHSTSTSRRERRESFSSRPAAAPPVSGMCYSRDSHTGELFGYPRDPNEDCDHLRICRKFPPPQRGFRYGYDSAGNVINFAVSRNADDYCDPADIEYRRRTPSRSASTSHRGDGGFPKRSYSTRDNTRPREYDDGTGGGLGRRPSTGRRYHSSRDEYYGGGGGSYDSMRAWYPPESFSRSYGGGSGRHERSGGGSSSLRPEAAYEEPKRHVVKPEDVDWEIETVV